MSVNQNSINQTVALAGLAQSIRIVQNIAWKGDCNPTDFKSVIASLIRIDAASAIAVYDGSFEVSTGLRILKQQLDTKNPNKDPEFVALAINLINLQKQLASNTRLLDNLSHSIAKISEKYSDQDFYQNDDIFNELLEACSTAYKQSVSKLPNRIQVKGEPKYLKIDTNQIKVRAALLCAMRSIVVWRQSGGSRWHFFFKKKDILSAVSYLLSNPQRE